MLTDSKREENKMTQRHLQRIHSSMGPYGSHGQWKNKSCGLETGTELSYICY